MYSVRQQVIHSEIFLLWGFCDCWWRSKSGSRCCTKKKKKAHCQTKEQFSEKPPKCAASGFTIRFQILQYSQSLKPFKQNSSTAEEPVIDLPDQPGKSSNACKMTQSHLLRQYPAAVSVTSGTAASVLLRENGIIRGGGEGILRHVDLYGRK